MVAPPALLGRAPYTRYYVPQQSFHPLSRASIHLRQCSLTLSHCDGCRSQAFKVSGGLASAQPPFDLSWPYFWQLAGSFSLFSVVITAQGVFQWRGILQKAPKRDNSFRTLSPLAHLVSSCLPQYEEGCLDSTILWTTTAAVRQPHSQIPFEGCFYLVRALHYASHGLEEPQLSKLFFKPQKRSLKPWTSASIHFRSWLGHGSGGPAKC